MTQVCAVTGAGGYVGSRIAEALGSDFTVLPITRGGVDGIAYDMASPHDLSEELRSRKVKVLVHAAWDMTQVKPSDYQRINVESSHRLIADAIAAGVERVVFISTISAFEGAKSLYGRSKLEVEKLITSAGGAAIRPGLVWGDRPGGMFGSIRAQIAASRNIPTVGDGRYPQYLVHEDDLAAAVLRSAHGEFAGRVLTVANPEPWLLRNLVLHLAAQQGKTVKLVGVPWRLIYGGLKTAETIGLKLNFRSDSVVSLVYQNAHPEFSSDVPARPFSRC